MAEAGDGVGERLESTEIDAESSLPTDRSVNNEEDTSDLKNVTQNTLEGFFDAAIVFTDKDHELACVTQERFSNLTLKNEEKPKICLYDKETFGGSEVKLPHVLLKRCGLILVLLTENFNGDKVREFMVEQMIGETRLNDCSSIWQEYCVRPLHTQPKDCRNYKLPFGMAAIRSYNVFHWHEKRHQKKMVDLFDEYRITYSDRFNPVRETSATQQSEQEVPDIEDKSFCESKDDDGTREEGMLSEIGLVNDYVTYVSQTAKTNSCDVHQTNPMKIRQPVIRIQQAKPSDDKQVQDGEQSLSTDDQEAAALLDEAPSLSTKEITVDEGIKNTDLNQLETKQARYTDKRDKCNAAGDDDTEPPQPASQPNPISHPNSNCKSDPDSNGKPDKHDTISNAKSYNKYNSDTESHYSNDPNHKPYSDSQTMPDPNAKPDPDPDCNLFQSSSKPEDSISMRVEVGSESFSERMLFDPPHEKQRLVKAASAYAVPEQYLKEDEDQSLGAVVEKTEDVAEGQYQDGAMGKLSGKQNKNVGQNKDNEKKIDKDTQRNNRVDKENNKDRDENNSDEEKNNKDAKNTDTEGNNRDEEGNKKDKEGNHKHTKGINKATEGKTRDEEENNKDTKGNGRDEEGNNKYGEENGRDEEGNNKYGEGNGRDEEGNNENEGNGRDEEGNNKYGEENGRDEEGNNKYGEGNGRDEEGNSEYDEGNGRDEEGNNKYGEGNGRDEEGNNENDEGNDRDEDGNNRDKVGNNKIMRETDRDTEGNIDEKGNNRDEEGNKGDEEETKIKTEGNDRDEEGNNKNIERNKREEVGYNKGTEGNNRETGGDNRDEEENSKDPEEKIKEEGKNGDNEDGEDENKEEEERKKKDKKLVSISGHSSLSCDVSLDQPQSQETSSRSQLDQDALALVPFSKKMNTVNETVLSPYFHKFEHSRTFMSAAPAFSKGQGLLSLGTENSTFYKQSGWSASCYQAETDSSKTGDETNSSNTGAAPSSSPRNESKLNADTQTSPTTATPQTVSTTIVNIYSSTGIKIEGGGSVRTNMGPSSSQQPKQEKARCSPQTQRNTHPRSRPDSTQNKHQDLDLDSGIDCVDTGLKLDWLPPHRQRMEETARVKDDQSTPSHPEPHTSSTSSSQEPLSTGGAGTQAGDKSSRIPGKSSNIEEPHTSEGHQGSCLPGEEGSLKEVESGHVTETPVPKKSSRRSRVRRSVACLSCGLFRNSSKHSK